MQILLILVLFFFQAPPITLAQKSTKSKTNNNNDNNNSKEIDKFFNREEIDKFIENVLKCRNIPAAAISVVKLNDDDQVAWQYAQGYGRTDPQCKSKRCESVDKSTIFCIGSITKSFTAGLIGKILLEKSDYEKTLWDTPLKQLLPCDQRDFYGGDAVIEKITIRDLLAHRLSIPDNTGLWYMGVDAPRAEIWKNIYRMKGNLPLAKYWRSSFTYNNWMYALVGHVSELLTNKTWEDLVEKFYFVPLAMKGAKFAHKAHEFYPKFAKFGIFKNNQWTSPRGLMTLLRNPSVVAPSGGICASSSDMQQYLRFLLSTNEPEHKNGVQRKIILDTFEPSNYFTDKVKINKPKFPVQANTYTYGMGWRQGVYRDYETIEHSGVLYGYRSKLMLIPDLKLGVFVAQTSSFVGGSQMDMSSVFAYRILDEALKESPWIDVNSACSIYPESWRVANKSSDFDEFDNGTLSGATPGYQFACDNLAKEYQNFSGQYKSNMFGSFAVIPDSDSDKKKGGFLRFKLGLSGEGKICKTHPPQKSEGPDTLRLQFEPPLDHLNSPPFSEIFNTTLVLKKPDAPGTVPSVLLGFYPQAEYNWVGSYDPESTSNPTSKSSRGRSAKASSGIKIEVHWSILALTFATVYQFWQSANTV